MIIDEIDSGILNCLEKNSRVTASDISKKVSLSIPAVSERIKKMEERGIIEKYTLKIRREAFGLKLLAMTFVNVTGMDNISTFREEIVKYPEVIECLHMAGEYDYLLKILVKDTEEFENFLMNKLKKIRGVDRTNTLIVLSTLKEEINRVEIF